MRVGEDLLPWSSFLGELAVYEPISALPAKFGISRFEESNMTWLPRRKRVTDLLEPPLRLMALCDRDMRWVARPGQHEHHRATDRLGTFREQATHLARHLDNGVTVKCGLIARFGFNGKGTRMLERLPKITENESLQNSS